MNKKQTNLSDRELYYLDHEMDDNHAVMDAMVVAMYSGDTEEEARLAKLVNIEPIAADSFKSVYGLKKFLELGFNTERVVTKYGKEWLEKENDDYIDMTDTWAKVTKMQEEIRAKKMKK